MSLDLYYIGKVSPELCDKARKELMELQGFDASTESDGSIKEHAVRNTTVRFAPTDHWFNDVLLQFGKEANKETGWNLDINQWETIQFAEYKNNQHYNWHMDTCLGSRDLP